ncbi:MAG: hypothetical protein WD400_03570 [Pontimonas sp.]
MSRIFSEEAQTRGGQRAMTRYHRSVWLVSVLAVVATVVALTVYAAQGPRLRVASVDVVRAVQFPGAVLRLESDRPLGAIKPSQVSVQPDTGVAVDVSGPIVSLVFTQALRYGTDYRVRIDDVAGDTRGNTGRWDYEFSTPSANLHYLDRGDAGAPDRIMRVGTKGQPPEVVYLAANVDVFVTIGSALITASSEPSGASRLEIVEPVGDDIQRLVLPENTAIDQLLAPATGTRFLFTLSSLDELGPYDRTLFIADAAGGSRPEALSGLDGEPLRVTKAAVTPGSSQVVAWVDEVQVVRIDVDSGLVLPVAGEAQEFWGVSSDGSEALMVDLGGTVAINVESLREQRIVPGTVGTREVFEGQTHLMVDGRRVQTVVIGNQTDTEFTSLVVLDDGEGSSIPLYRTPDDLGSIGRFVVSPGDQYVAIEMTPNRGDAEADGRLLEPRNRSVTTVVVSIDSGQVVRSVEGFWPIW